VTRLHSVTARQASSPTYELYGAAVGVSAFQRGFGFEAVERRNLFRLIPPFPPFSAFEGSFLFSGKRGRGGRRDIWASRQQCPTRIDQSLVASSATYELYGAAVGVSAFQRGFGFEAVERRNLFRLIPPFPPFSAFEGSFLFSGKRRIGGRRNIWASRLLRLIRQAHGRQAQGRQQCPTSRFSAVNESPARSR
jgi:hypothetical protein